MLMNRQSLLKPSRTLALESTTLQAAVLLLLATLLPAIPLFVLNAERYIFGGVIASIAGSAFGVVLGTLLLNRVGAYPGASALGLVIPSYASSFGIALFAFFALRLDYSRLYLVGSAILALCGAFYMCQRLARLGKRRFFLVPFGGTEFMRDLPDVEWLVMSEPLPPSGRNIPIVADLRHDHEPEWERMLALAAVDGCPVYHTKQIREMLTGRVSIEHLSENSFGSLLPNLAFVKAKRVTDVLGALVILPILLIPMLGVAALIRFSSPGPILFKQERMGYRGKVFNMLKFRSMEVQSRATAEEQERVDAMTRDEDPRITWIGRHLRRYRLDELPQVINVLKGDMSFIGPRPEAVALSRWYEAELPFYHYRHIVRPGMSGWAQVHQGHVTDLDQVHEKLHYDFFYIKNFSAWLDLLIALRTVPTMLFGHGAR
jgi:lipopolysaccharide/colanic/teichoic acid biosynthesis glycosyltransferase